MISKLARIPEFLAWQSLVMQQNLSKEVSWLNDFSLQNYHQRMMDLAINGWPIGSEYCIRTVWPSIGSQTVKLFNIFTGHKNVPSPSAPPFHVIRPGGRWVRLGCVISPGKTRTVEAAESAGWLWWAAGIACGISGPIFRQYFHRSQKWFPLLLCQHSVW